MSLYYICNQNQRFCLNKLGNVDELLAIRKSQSLPIFLSLNMSNYLLPLAPFYIEDDLLGSWLGMMPVTFAAIYVGRTFKGLSEITHGWNEVSTTQWVFLFLVLGISVILLAFVTRIAKAQISSSLTPEMLHLVEGKEMDLLKHVIVRIDDPVRKDLV